MFNLQQVFAMFMIVFGAMVYTNSHADVNVGKQVFQQCIGCHGVIGEGAIGPKLQGQSQKEIIEKLNDYRAGKQRGPMSSMMTPIADGLSDEDVKNVAEYIATMKVK